MDAAKFEHWLGGMASLNERQRRQAWQALALSEVADGRDVEPAVVDISTTGPARRQTRRRHGLRSAQERLVLPNLGNAAWTASVARIATAASRALGKGERSAALSLQRLSRTFNALTKTPLAGLRMKDKWAAQAEAMIDGVSIAKAAKRCGVDYTTAFRWRHRFLASLSGDKPETLSGIVEGDETFILESFKGKRSGMPRKARKRGGKSAKRGISAEQIPVIVARDRQGATTDAVLPKLNRVSITAALGGIITSANEFCCDGGTAIVAFARRAGIPTHILPMPGKPNPQAPDFHINNVNAYHGRLKEWLRRFHGVATKNLPNYLGWRRTLEALGPTVPPDDLILGAIGLGPYQQVTAL